MERSSRGHSHIAEKGIPDTRSAKWSLFSPKAPRRYFISHASRCISMRICPCTHIHEGHYSAVGQRKKFRDVARWMKVDRITGTYERRGGSAVNRKASVPATRRYETHGMHPRVSCIPLQAALLFMPGALSGTKPSSGLRQSKSLNLSAIVTLARNIPNFLSGMTLGTPCGGQGLSFLPRSRSRPAITAA